MVRHTVKGIGSKVRHTVDVPDAIVITWEFEGRKFVGIETPLVAICKVLIRSEQPCVAVVQAGSTNCPRCLKLIGNNT